MTHDATLMPLLLGRCGLRSAARGDGSAVFEIGRPDGSRIAVECRIAGGLIRVTMPIGPAGADPASLAFFNELDQICPFGVTVGIGADDVAYAHLVIPVSPGHVPLAETFLEALHAQLTVVDAIRAGRGLPLDRMAIEVGLDGAQPLLVPTVGALIGLDPARLAGQRAFVAPLPSTAPYPNTVARISQEAIAGLCVDVLDAAQRPIRFDAGVAWRILRLNHVLFHGAIGLWHVEPGWALPVCRYALPTAWLAGAEPPAASLLTPTVCYTLIDNGGLALDDLDRIVAGGQIARGPVATA